MFSALFGNFQILAEEVEVSPAIERMAPAVVRIHVVMEEGSEGRMKKQRGSGSGVIISDAGHVLTNHHVAGRGTRFRCTLANREKVDATLVGTDALSDLAVIKLDLATRRNPGEPLTVAAFGDSDALEVGDTVFAMGSPGGLSQSITRGIVANTEMIVPRHQIPLELDGERVGELVRWIGHDAVIYGGNSGGPLANRAGEIVGINEVGIASLGGAIPSNLAREVSAGLIEHGEITRSWTGLEAQTLLRHSDAGRGALVASVWPDSPADLAGIRAGDFITRYDGEVVPDCHAEENLPLFNAAMLGSRPGAEVEVHGLRDGDPQTWKLVPERRQPALAKERERREWGLTLRDLTTVSALERRRDTTDGVLVDTVKTAGPSGQAKPPLRSDDIILAVGDTELRDLDDFEAFTDSFVEGLTAPEPVMVRFERDSESLVTVVDIGPSRDPVQPRSADKAWLGATHQVLTDELATALGIAGKRGVRLTSVMPDSPAGRAGLKPGDLLLKLDGRVIDARRPEDQNVLPERIRAYPIDAEIEFEGWRDGEPLAVTVRLEARPDRQGEAAEYEDERFEFTAAELTEPQRREAELDSEDGGVLVKKVVANGWASLGGLMADDIILRLDGDPVPSLDAFQQKLKRLRESKPPGVALFVKRDASTRFLELEPDW